MDDPPFGLTLACPNSTCTFLKGGRCVIYEDRPLACYQFDCTDPRAADSVVFEDFPELKVAVERHLTSAVTCGTVVPEQ